MTNWIRSSACSGGQCIEARPEPVAFVKSTFCDLDSNCVEAGAEESTGYVQLRDSKNPDQPPLRLSAEAWRGFLELAPTI